MRITADLIRRKSEHNEDGMHELEEIALHQLEIEKIELLDRLCKDLKILLLQNNLIERLENLGRLKRLEYLNVALNNIALIENVERCETLKKLDLTVNFIELANLEASLNNLKENACLEDLYLMGNPCTEWKGYRAFTIACLTQLKQLDGMIITPSERIEALRALPALQADLTEEIQRIAQRPANESENAYTRENRKKMYLEMAKQEGGNSNSAEEPSKKTKVFQPYNSKGEIRQCNEGKLQFSLDPYCEPGRIIATFQLPRHLSTLLIDVDIHPTYLRVTVKGKVTQLRLPDEVSPDNSTVKRSQTTGELRICMPLANQADEKKSFAPKRHLPTQKADIKTQAKPEREYLELQADADTSGESDAPPLEEIGSFE